MIFHRTFSCLALLLSLPCLSGCTTRTCTYEEAEDYELNEIYFDLTATDNSLQEAGYVENYITLKMHDSGGTPLMAEKLENIQIRYAGKPCDPLYDDFDLSCGEEELGLPTPSHSNEYHCYVDSADMPGNAVITASYQRGDTSASVSLVWPGIVSNLNIQEAVNKDTWVWAVSLAEDMTISWKLPEEGIPDSLLVELSVDYEVPFFSTTLSGSSTGMTIPKSTFEGLLASGRDTRLSLSVSSITNGKISSLAAGGDSRAERIVRQTLEALACEPEEIETYFVESSAGYFQQYFQCSSEKYSSADAGGVENQQDDI